MTEYQQNIFNLVRRLYKDNEGKPIELKMGEIELFEIIFKKLYQRVHVMTHTRYGKSLTTGLAVLTRCSLFPEKWAILAGTKEKAQIIMDYIIAHIFDNPLTSGKFVIDEGETVDSIRRYRNKKRLTFQIEAPNKETGSPGLYSEIYIQSAKEALGFGAPNVIEDESALIDDQNHALVMRMLGDDRNNFMVKIGNPFYRNHFLKSFRDPNYYKLVIDHERGVQEGRLTKDYVEEMRKEAFFDVLYECKFPDAESLDDKGYTPLLTEREVDSAYVPDISIFGDLRLGVDVAGGGSNFSTIVLRGDNAAKLLFKEPTSDTMVLITKTLEFSKQYNIPVDDEHIFIDKVGVGKGVCDRMNEVAGLKSNGSSNSFGVNVGEAPEQDEDGSHMQMANLRAQAYWRTGQWIKQGSKLVGKGKFDEMLDIKYKVQSDRKIKIKPKEDMIQEGIASPDVADGLMLTFTKKKQKVHKAFRQKPWESATEIEG